MVAINSSELQKKTRVDPLTYVFNFGRHDTKTFQQVWNSDPDYIHWCVDGKVRAFDGFPSVDSFGTRYAVKFKNIADGAFIDRRLDETPDTPLIYPDETLVSSEAEKKTLSQLLSEIEEEEKKNNSPTFATTSAPSVLGQGVAGKYEPLADFRWINF